MNIETPFDLGQKVWRIQNASNPHRKPCKVCEGTGMVTVPRREKQILCPDCNGRAWIKVYPPAQWNVMGEITIGMITAIAINKLKDEEKETIFDNTGHYFKEGNTTFKFEYMCYETGLGSGSLYNDNWIFATQEEAQAECDRRNSELVQHPQ
jgi:hypothetical protein